MIDERKLFLGTGAVRFATKPNAAAKKILPSATLQTRDNYVVCIVVGRHELLPQSDTELHGAKPQDLQALAVQMLKNWLEKERPFISGGDSESFFIVGMYTSVPGVLDSPVNVTLLGDAVHAMTPTLGRGANFAMRDAALLARQLKTVATGEKPLAEALGTPKRDSCGMDSKLCASRLHGRTHSPAVRKTLTDR